MAHAQRTITAMAAGLAILGAVLAGCAPTTPQQAPPGAPPSSPQRPGAPPPAGAPTGTPYAPAPTAPSRPCVEAPAFAAAAAENAASLRTLAFAPFRRPEIGWDIYLPLVAREIGTTCQPNSSGFAADLARWEARYGLPADGRVTAAAFDVFKGVWQERRPFVMATVGGACPDHPDQLGLALAERSESYGGKLIQLRRGALNAYRQMVAAARQAVPEVAANPQALQIFSGYRSPESDEFRCLTEGNCQGVTRAKCSAHRTGLALDISLGSAPGFTVDSTADDNRRFMVQSATYRWLVANAPRFGFVNYPFEPWHWEWMGEAP